MGAAFGAALVLPTTAGLADDANADSLLRAAFDNWRGRSSQTEADMTVHRPEWERKFHLKTWTLGDDDALVRFTAPAEDAGNATLKLDEDTWTFNPRVNQIIKLPASMLVQSWMGSDFSYNDLAKANDILTKYTHRTVSAQSQGNHTVYSIEALPKPGAAVVWGKLVARVRDDGIMIGQTFFDQDMQPVRVMVTDEIGMVGGRLYPLVVSIHPSGREQSWTSVKTLSGQFNLSLPSYLFSLSNLQNRRE